MPADDRRCQYTIYKRPKDVPAEVYERCGRRKPASMVASARTGPPRHEGA
jgi:hypothetical protein